MSLCKVLSIAPSMNYTHSTPLTVRCGNLDRLGLPGGIGRPATPIFESVAAALNQ